MQAKCQISILNLQNFAFYANCDGFVNLTNFTHEYTVSVIIHIYSELKRMKFQIKHVSLPQNRAVLARVLSSSRDVIKIDHVTQALGISRTDGAKRLARWVEQGWLHRVGRGVYVPVALDTLGAEQILDDPWVLIPSLYEPAYIAGRTAAEYWDLTEQIFKDLVVITGQPIRQRRQVRHGTHIVLKHLDEKKIFGTKPVWRHHTKVFISDVHRTVVDMLDDPAIGGGIQHVADCLNTYLKRSDRADHKLIEYAERLGNGAVFKRLGFLAERYATGTKLATLCQARMSSGLAKLDPALSSPRINSKWKLRISDTWVKESTT